MRTKREPGGEGGIRTRDTLASMPHFECGAFNHSATSPMPYVYTPGNLCSRLAGAKHTNLEEWASDIREFCLTGKAAR
jgi:hypothetical protein